MLVVNLSYNPSHLEEFLKKNTSSEKVIVLDFASSFAKDALAEVIYPSDLDDKNELHKAALNDYINEMGQVSKALLNNSTDKDIRSVIFEGLPLYWLTDISEKHPQNCVLKNLYYFKFIHSKINYSGKQIAFVLPTSAPHFIGAIKTYVNKNLPQMEVTLFNIQQPAKHSLRVNISYVRNFYKKTSELRSILAKVSSQKQTVNHLVFTYVPQTWREELQGDYVLSEIVAISKKQNKTSKYVPYFFDYNCLKTQKVSEKWDNVLYKCFPTSFQILKFHYKLLQFIIRAQSLKLSNESFSFVNSEVIQSEFNNLLKDKTEYLFNYMWLSNYFTTFSRPVSVFYQDEFYPQGRIISAAIQNSGNENIASYGVQHGIFYEAHTVYAITDSEIENTFENNGMPIPKKFIVWGDYFKNHFLKFNSLKRDYVISAGNPNYFKHNVPKEPSTKAENKIVRILWCTTLKIDFINQYKNIISKFINQTDKVQIKIRCHPQVDIREFIKTSVSPSEAKQIEFSTSTSIHDDLMNCDAVLTSSGSTVFLDAIIAKKPILNLINNDYFMGDLGESEMIKIRTDGDLKTAMEQISQRKFHINEYSDLLNTNQKVWQNILN